MLDKAFDKLMGVFLEMTVKDIPQCINNKAIYIASIIFSVIQIIVANQKFITMSFQCWIIGRILSSIAKYRESHKILEFASDQLIYIAFPILIRSGFQYSLLTSLLLGVNNYLEMYVESYKHKCIIGHGEIFLTYSLCYLFPEFFVFMSMYAFRKQFS